MPMRWGRDDISPCQSSAFLSFRNIDAERVMQAGKGPKMDRDRSRRLLWGFTRERVMA